MTITRLLGRVGRPLVHLRPDPAILAGDTYDSERTPTNQGTVQGFVEPTTGAESAGGGQSVIRVRIITTPADIRHYDVLRDSERSTDYEVLWVVPQGMGLSSCMLIEAQVVVGTP